MIPNAMLTITFDGSCFGWLVKHCRTVNRDFVHCEGTTEVFVQLAGCSKSGCPPPSLRSCIDWIFSHVVKYIRASLRYQQVCPGCLSIRSSVSAF